MPQIFLFVCYGVLVFKLLCAAQGVGVSGKTAKMKRGWESPSPAPSGISNYLQVN